MIRLLALALALIMLAGFFGIPAGAGTNNISFKTGNEVLYDRYYCLIEAKRVGLITNQSGVNTQGRSTIDVLANDPLVNLVALYGPEHGIDGQARAGEWVESYTHPELGIPVYSLYGATRMPTEAMLEGIDVLLFDVQDIGARTYTYISTLNYVMKAAAQYDIPVVVLDRPNPLGGEIVEGPVAEEKFISFVGVDKLPMAHGMTVGELARFFNRNIGANLTVVPMEGYTRDMIYHDTGMEWVATSPNIPDIDSVFGYMATGLGEGTGIYQSDKFKWIGGKGIDPHGYAQLLNNSGLPGVTFIPEVIGSAGGVRLQITDYRTFNPAKSGIYALAYAKQVTNFNVPKSGSTPGEITMFDKVMGTDRMGIWLEQNLTPREIENRYAAELEEFKKLREQCLIYGYMGKEGGISVIVNNVPIFFDAAPYINGDYRTMVPVRSIAEHLGALVTWDGSLRQVTITKDDLVIEMTVDTDYVEVNGERKIMDTKTTIKNDRTMVPVRFVSNFLGASVDWEGESNSVIVNY